MLFIYEYIFLICIGSIEEVVENLVKEWEMQASHIEDTDTWSTISKTKYTLRVNEVSEVDGKEAAKIGNYNTILKQCKHYQKCKTIEDKNSYE